MQIAQKITPDEIAELLTKFPKIEGYARTIRSDNSGNLSMIYTLCARGNINDMRAEYIAADAANTSKVSDLEYESRHQDDRFEINTFSSTVKHELYMVVCE